VYGSFLSDDGKSASPYATLNDADAYARDTKVNAGQDVLSSEDTYVEAGFGPTLYDVFVAGIGLIFLAIGLAVFKHVKPARKPSRTLSVPELVGITGGLAILLDGVVGLVGWLVSLAV
jgi:hypothetical protein